MEKGQQDTKKRADIQKEPDYTRSRINICICVGICWDWYHEKGSGSKADESVMWDYEKCCI